MAELTHENRRTVAIIGASPQPAKFGNQAVRAHLSAGWQVFPVYPTAKTILGIPAYPRLEEIPLSTIERVSLYIPPAIGRHLLRAIAEKQPREVWLNPGSADDELIAAAERLGLPLIQACSILAAGQFPVT